MKPAEKYRAWKAHRPEKPIFRTILFSMMAVLLAEVILLSTGIGLTNVSGRLNQNAKQIVNMQVRNRASYLQDMLIKAQELTDISTTINNLTQQMLQDGTISLDTMDQSSEAADPLMEAAAPYLVSALRARPVTGIFLVINTHDLAEKEVGSPMPSVYLRDLDPDARPSDRNTDLMLERSSAAVVKALGITTDKSWSTALNCRGLTNGGFVRTVFQTAWEDDEKLDAADYGRWLTQTYKLTGDERTAIAYSQPLILPDGTPAPVGETGEIVIRTDKHTPCGLFMGYYRDEEKTREAWSGGVYHTGDTAWRDEDGYFFYVGRTDDVIKSSGYRIGPFEIESVIMELPYVLECAVTSAPDPIRGQVVKASIVLTKGTQGTEALKKEIQTYVKTNTAPYKYPRIVEFRDELPKTISGKIRRVELKG